MNRATGRLDSFTDAAFAFALSLLVIGNSQIPTNIDELQSAMANVPVFAIGFAIIGMFWYGHVRWREYRGDGGGLSVVLTFALVFFVMIYIPPLQAMSASFAAYLGGSGTRFAGDIGGMFLIYGVGFTALSAVLALLFWEAEGAMRRAGNARWRIARGEMGIWLILGVTGLFSILLASIAATKNFAPFVHATLPVSIGLFVWRYRWVEPVPETEMEAGPEA